MNIIGITEPMMYAMIACLVMMIFDIITGFIGAWENKNIDSKIMREGIFHKATLVLLIILAWLCEVFIVHVPELGVSVPLVIPVCVMIFSMELISILENLTIINPELKNNKLLDLFKITHND